MNIEKSLYFTSLGCSKNLVDSQVMLGYLGLDGYEVVPNADEASVIVVNTCSFVDAAKKESIDTVLEMADFKNPENGKCRALVMSGCMAQRYSGELEKAMPEVDMFIGTGEYHKIDKLLKAFDEGSLEQKSFVEIPKYIHTEMDPRVNTSPSHMAWLKVSEGCNRNCTFCIIPTLRGKLRSRSVESLVTETHKLLSSGVKEINIISQDLSDYGSDLSEDDTLLDLLKALEEIEDLNWVRLFYYYPDELSDEVIDFIASSKKVCRYLDMPIQHFSSQILRRMNRKIETDEMVRKIRRLKSSIPDLALRTSVIVGFPGETQEDFEMLKTYITEMEFNHLGVFKYSDEEGTPAFKLEPKVSQDIIDDRFQELYEIQKEISAKKIRAYVGQTLEVLVEGAHDDTELLIKGRHQGQAPDIDGCVIINDGFAYPGDIVKVEITDSHDYDLVGRIVL